MTDQIEGEGQACIGFDTETRRLLLETGVSLEHIVRHANIEGLAIGADPAPPPNAKDVFTVLVGSAAVIAAATPVILQLIERLTLKPVIVDEIETETVRDSSGDVVCDAKGRPVLVKHRRKVLLQPTVPRQSERKFEVKGAGFQIGIADRQEP
jgi:hypothetical protein